MNTDFFIAKRIIFGQKKGARISKPIINIAIASIAVGLAIMIIAIAVVTGFKNEIESKVIGFGSHIQITKYDANESFEPKPVSKDQSFYPHIDTVPGIRHIQVFATKAGTFKTETEVEGIMMKGVSSDFDWSFFKQNMIRGDVLNVTDSSKSNNIVISKYLADRLQLDTNEHVVSWFIQDDKLRPRKFKITGIYETGFEELDKLYVLADIKHIQKLNNWSEDQVAGFEVLIEDISELEELKEFVYENIGYDFDARSIKESYAHIFDWLKLQDKNVIVILFFTILVATINMITALLILILEKTNFIGILKSLGANNMLIRMIFVYQGAYLVVRGLVWGNILGILTCWLQSEFSLIKLSKESYYVSEVPVELHLDYLIYLNLGTLIVVTLIMLAPSYLITRIQPVRAIRYE